MQAVREGIVKQAEYLKENGHRLIVDRSAE
jgi:hypothetical protein